MMTLKYAAPCAAILLAATPALAQDLCSFAGKFPPGCPGTQAVQPMAPEPVSPPVLGDEGVMTPDQLLPIFRDVFRVHGCALPLSTGEMQFAETLSGMIGVPVATLRDTQAPWFGAIRSTFEQARAAGTVVRDSDAGMMRYPGCDQ
ncbi:MAG: hypothetical protein H6898_09315 [Rhodobacter sp.]|nr:hypothetical protein [Paracoccaceae bacterium]MCC0076769.1 hypothetical protein [Rhodobacter sp.]